MTEKTLKIIILGSSEVGKTCIYNRYFHNDFKENLQQQEQIFKQNFLNLMIKK